MESKHKYLFYGVPDYQSRLIKEHIKDPKYKTELCKNYVKYGKCSYKGKCRYAHGESELISKNLSNKNYKKTNCDKFYTSPGVCPYGFRCQYIHELRTLDNIEFLQNNYYQTVLWIKRYSDYVDNSRIAYEHEGQDNQYTQDSQHKPSIESTESKETTLELLGEVSEKQKTPFNLKSYFKAGNKHQSKVNKDAESIYEANSSNSQITNDKPPHEIYPKRLQVFADISKQSSEYIDVNAKFQLVDSDKVKNINMNYSTESASTASSYNPYLHYFLNKAAVEKINYGKLIDMNYYSINKNKESNLYNFNKDNEDCFSNFASRKQSLVRRSCDSSVTETTRDTRDARDARENRDSDDFLRSLKSVQIENFEEKVLK